jgi:hypothetical protein
LTDLTANGFRGDTVTNTQVISITDTSRVQIVGTGADTKIIINPQFDLDFSSNYSLSVSSGAFRGTASGQNTLDFTTVNFSTVTPGVGQSAAVQAQVMNETTGALQNSLKWFDASNIGNPSSSFTVLDLLSGDYALAMKFDSLVGGEPVIEGDSNLLLKNFGANDLLYFDNQDNALTGLQAEMNEAAFSQGVGSAGDPFGLNVAGTGDLNNVVVFFEIAAGNLLPDFSQQDALIPYVISTKWSNTGMVIVA